MTERLEERLQKDQNNRRRKSLAVMGTVAMLFLAAVACSLAYWWFGGAMNVARPESKGNTEADRIIEMPNKLNVIVMGVDSRPKDGDPGRSDTLLVVTVDTKSQEISAMSIPRDTRVRIPGHGWDKINHAFFFGGAVLTQRTTEEFLGIHVDYYATVDLDCFVRIVDAIGGVSLDVEKRMQYEDTWDHFVIDLRPGWQHLDGKTAIQYVRYRDEDGDIGRVARQQKFLRALLTQALQPQNIVKAPRIIRESFAALDTNIPGPLLLGLAGKLKDGLGKGLKASMVEGLPYYIDDISYWVPDIMKVRRTVAEMQGSAFSGNLQLAAQRIEEEYQANLPVHAHLDDGTYYYGMDGLPAVPRNNVQKPPVKMPTNAQMPDPKEKTPPVTKKTAMVTNNSKTIQ